jgi:tetratricopeptide (TPR) repeat protein
LQLAAAAAIGLATPQVSIGCLWMYGTDVHGHDTKVLGDDYGYDPVTAAHQDHLSRAEWERKSKELEGKIGDGDYKIRNDYAVTLVHLGQYDQAIQILQAIEKEESNNYVTAANLGTTYELQGKDDLAVHWIEEGIRRNSDSHYGTEWLHVEILKAKLELAKDPHWLDTHSMMGLDFGDGKLPVVPQKYVIERSKHPDRELADAAEPDLYALMYQLRERIELVGPPDPIVANLLETLANLLATTRTLETAIPNYRAALEYGSPHADLIRRRIDESQRLIDANQWARLNPLRTTHGQVITAFLLLLTIVVLVPLMLLVRWRRRARRTAGDNP